MFSSCRVDAIIHLPSNVSPLSRTTDSAAAWQICTPVVAGDTHSLLSCHTSQFSCCPEHPLLLEYTQTLQSRSPDLCSRGDGAPLTNVAPLLLWPINRLRGFLLIRKQTNLADTHTLQSLFVNITPANISEQVSPLSKRSVGPKPFPDRPFTGSESCSILFRPCLISVGCPSVIYESILHVCCRVATTSPSAYLGHYSRKEYLKGKTAYLGQGFITK